MFNDKYGQTKDVLEGRKTQERKIIKMPDYDEEYLDTAFDWDFRESVIIDRYAMYKDGEIVAVAQCYKDLGYREFDLDICPNDYKTARGTLGQSKGWNNKMFVRADACKHLIRITDLRIERLQEISDEDCLKEGVRLIKENIISQSFGFEGKYEIVGDFPIYDTPQAAYAHLTDKINGKGTWESNPYVFVYDFKLIK